MAEQSSNPNPFLGDQIPEKSGNLAEVVHDKVTGTPPSTWDSSSMVDTTQPDETISTPSSKWRHRTVRRSLITLLLVVSIVGIIYGWFRYTRETPVSDELLKPTVEAEPVAPLAIIPGTLVLPDDSANYQSENFKAGEIVVGGELEFLVDEDEAGALTVENIRGEAFTEKNKQEVKLVVTWTTNKLTQASVRYSKGVGQTERSVDEADYSYNHSVIISGLDPASTYLYTIDASDRYGNQVKSEPHAVFTGARTVSLFDLIAGAIGDVFGWAVTSK